MKLPFVLFVPLIFTKSLLAKLIDYLYTFIRTTYEIVSVVKTSVYIVIFVAQTQLRIVIHPSTALHYCQSSKIIQTPFDHLCCSSNAILYTQERKHLLTQDN